MNRLDSVEGGIARFSEGYKAMGCHVDERNNFVCTQWAPGAQVRRGSEDIDSIGAVDGAFPTPLVVVVAAAAFVHLLAVVVSPAAAAVVVVVYAPVASPPAVVGKQIPKCLFLKKISVFHLRDWVYFFRRCGFSATSMTGASTPTHSRSRSSASGR